jgi:RNA polymerase sigma-70 factor (ECF subfamily)
MDDRDAEAFRALYRAHYRTVCRYLAVRTDRDGVEDAAAETFLVAWRRQSELPVHVVPWLLNTAARCLANQRRARQRSEALVERVGSAIASGAGGIDEDLGRREQARALLRALAALKHRDRELVVLRHWDGLSPRDIGIVLELSPVVARARLHRASRRLRQEYERELDGGERDPRRPAAPALTETFELTET